MLACRRLRGICTTLDSSANSWLQAGFFIGFGALPAAGLVYYISRPGKDGEPSSITKAIESWSDLGKQWEHRNTLHTAAIEQAAHDKHLYYNAGRNAHIELKYPE